MDMLLSPVSNAVAADQRLCIYISFCAHAHDDWWAGLPRLGSIDLWRISPVMLLEEQYLWLKSHTDSASMTFSSHTWVLPFFRDPVKDPDGYAGNSRVDTKPADAGSIFRICIGFRASVHDFVKLWLNWSKDLPMMGSAPATNSTAVLPRRLLAQASLRANKWMLRLRAFKGTACRVHWRLTACWCVSTFLPVRRFCRLQRRQ